MAIDLTQAYIALNSGYTQHQINNSIRYDFTHNGYNCHIYYTPCNGLQNSITIIVDINNTFYPFAIHMINSTNVSEYIPNEIYTSINNLFVTDNYSTHDFFEHIRDTIINTVPVGNSINPHTPGFYHYQNPDNNPYFECFARQNMSDKMKKRLYNTYPANFVHDLLYFCRQHNITTRFTSDITRAHDIILEMQNYT